MSIFICHFDKHHTCNRLKCESQVIDWCYCEKYRESSKRTLIREECLIPSLQNPNLFHLNFNNMRNEIPIRLYMLTCWSRQGVFNWINWKRIIWIHMAKKEKEKKTASNRIEGEKDQKIHIND